MLIVYFHALKPVNFLDFVDEVGLGFVDTQNVKDVVRIFRSFTQPVASQHAVAGVNHQMLAVRYEVLSFLVVFTLDNDLLLTADNFPELNSPIDFGNNRRIARPTGLKQLGHTGQTAGNITGFGYHTRHFHQNVTGFHRLAVGNL